LGDALDTSKFELVSYPQLFHLALQVSPTAVKWTPPAAQRSWSDDVWRDPDNWHTGNGATLARQGDDTLRLETTDRWGLIRMTGLRLPEDARAMRIRLKDMSPNVVYYVIFQGDFLKGLGRPVRENVPVFQNEEDQNLIYESRVRDNEMVLPSNVAHFGAPLSLQIKLSSIHSDKKPGYIVIEDIQFSH